MSVQFNRNHLTVDGITVDFEDEIVDALAFENSIVIITDIKTSTTNENVFGVSQEGVILWQVPKMKTFIKDGKEFTGIDKPYSGLTKVSEEAVRLHNWDSTYFDVDVVTGKLLTDPMDSRIGRRPW